jgi:hypothetical protein
MLSDIDLDAKQYSFEEIQKMTVAERISIMRAMTIREITLARQKLAAENPYLSDKEVEVLWAEITYGKEVTKGLREDLRQKGML